MAFRLKVTKTNGREYAAIVENIYSKQRHGSSSKTVRTYGDLVKLRCKNPNIDEEIMTLSGKKRLNRSITVSPSIEKSGRA